MAKKSKKDKSLPVPVENDSSVNSTMEFFKDNAKQIGATIAGLIAAEIAQVTVNQLLQRMTKDGNDSDGNDNGLQAVAASALSDLKGKVEDVKEPVEASASSVKAAAADVPPALSGIADLVKNAAQKALAQSMDTLGDSLNVNDLTSQAVVAGAADSAKNLVGAIASGNSGKSNQKSKKKGKKKNKKS